MQLTPILQTPLGQWFQNKVVDPVKIAAGIQVLGMKHFVQPPPRYSLTDVRSERTGTHLKISFEQPPRFASPPPHLSADAGARKYTLQIGLGTEKPTHSLSDIFENATLYDTLFRQEYLGWEDLGVFLFSLPTTLPLSPLLYGLAEYYKFMEAHVWQCSRYQHALLKALDGQLPAGDFAALKTAFQRDWHLEAKFGRFVDAKLAEEVLNNSTLRVFDVEGHPTNTRHLIVWQDKDGDVVAAATLYNKKITAMQILNYSVNPQDSHALLSNFGGFPLLTHSFHWFSEKYNSLTEYERDLLDNVLPPRLERIFSALDEPTKKAGYAFSTRAIRVAVESVKNWIGFQWRLDSSNQKPSFIIHEDGSVSVPAGVSTLATASAEELARNSSYLEDRTFEFDMNERKPGYFSQVRAMLELRALLLGLREVDDYGKQITGDKERELTPVFTWLYRAAGQNPEIFGPEFELAGRDNTQGTLTLRWRKD